ncbi:enterochelin esterase-like enzyme [Caldalkalibacillus uzonensis]|uniref:Enterochelin esterase-like enzyme n=1 Tax=Caldalkalibacillus uzonensis TaxID=353224 RepID=A0ABU0CVK5_9BACI|nr:alpha/beta hydrolase-fold protein [Caldalkalibacillus uzonensis]MDQ0340415.1 enterochelin esterase-like enzyme [Caldalkalibacillus uzonensis]
MSDKNYLKRTVIKESINSRFLNEERPVRIYLPPGYNELVSYPIVYTQDGQDAFMYGRIATIANYLILEKGMEPIIIVGVDVDKKKRTSEYSPIGSRHDAYKRFFVEELCPFIESRYELRQNGISRVLLGDSLGATVSLHIALDHPDWFHYVISLSGAFLNPSLEQLATEPHLEWLNMWMLIGTQETEVETHMGTFDFLDWNRRAKAVLEEKGADITYLEKEGQHIWGFWQKHLPDCLMHYFGPDKQA